MFECLFSDGRKEDGESTPQGAPPLAIFTPQAAGSRRDRTAQFRRMRAAAAMLREGPPGDVRQITEEDSVPLSAELSAIQHRVSTVHSSLATKLAQHNGLKQFGADFSDRAPPLELRMLLPELEASIEGLLEVLHGLGVRLRLLRPEGLGGARPAELRGVLVVWVADILQQASATFEAQRTKVRELAVASPLLSPMMAPSLGKRLASAMSSPQRSYVEPFKESPSTTSTMSHAGSVRTPMTITPTPLARRLLPDPLDLDELEDFVLEEKDEISEGESEDDAQKRYSPFSSVFAAPYPVMSGFASS